MDDIRKQVADYLTQTLSVPASDAWEHAGKVLDLIVLTQEWSDDVAGPDWARYFRWVTKTVMVPGPNRVAAGLT